MYSGPQEPFDKNRSYGQEPGFISRHSSKLYVLAAIAAIVLIIWFFAVLLQNTDSSISAGR